jgi:hypothetical protein
MAALQAMLPVLLGSVLREGHAMAPTSSTDWRHELRLCAKTPELQSISTQEEKK